MKEDIPMTLIEFHKVSPWPSYEILRHLAQQRDEYGLAEAFVKHGKWKKPLILPRKFFQLTKKKVPLARSRWRSQSIYAG